MAMAMWHMDRARFYASIGDDARALQHLSASNDNEPTPGLFKPTLDVGCDNEGTTEHKMICFKQLSSNRRAANIKLLEQLDREQKHHCSKLIEDNHECTRRKESVIRMNETLSKQIQTQEDLQKKAEAEPRKSQGGCSVM